MTYDEIQQLKSGDLLNIIIGIRTKRGIVSDIDDTYLYLLSSDGEHVVKTKYPIWQIQHYIQRVNIYV